MGDFDLLYHHLLPEVEPHDNINFGGILTLSLNGTHALASYPQNKNLLLGMEVSEVVLRQFPLQNKCIALKKEKELTTILLTSSIFFNTFVTIN